MNTNELKDLQESITPGPWGYEGDTDGHVHVETIALDGRCGALSVADIELIAITPNLLDEVLDYRSRTEWGFDWLDVDTWRPARIDESGALEDGRSWWPTRESAETWAIEGLDGNPYRMVYRHVGNAKLCE